MNEARTAILNGIKDLIADLKDYAGGLPFGGTNETNLAALEKKEAKNENYTGRWPGVMRGYGPITRLYDWEKSL